MEKLEKFVYYFGFGVGKVISLFSFTKERDAVGVETERVEKVYSEKGA